MLTVLCSEIRFFAKPRNDVTKSLRASATSPGGFAVRSPFRDFVHLKVLRNAKHFAKPPGVSGQATTTAINVGTNRIMMTKTEVETTKCYGCGATVDNIAGKPHKYIGATQGCWNLYGQVLAKEYGEYNYPELTLRLTVDTYAIQHPGQPGSQSIQSVNGHLVSLYFVFVKNLSGKEATKKIGEI